MSANNKFQRESLAAAFDSTFFIDFFFTDRFRRRRRRHRRLRARFPDFLLLMLLLVKAEINHQKMIFSCFSTIPPN